jgi:nitrogen-specific signal transduction histidine kinase
MLAKEEISLTDVNKVTSPEELNKLKSVFSNFNYVFCISSLDGTIQYINSVLPALLGVTEDSFIGHSTSEIITRFVHPEDLTHTIQAVSEAVNGQRISGFENRYHLPDGSYQRFSWMLIPLSQENLFYAIAFKAERRESPLSGKPERAYIEIQNIFHNISDYFYVLDNEWKFVYVNTSAAQRFSEVMDQNIIGKFYWDLFPEKDDLYFLKFSEAKLTQKHAYFEAYSILTDGWVRVNVYPSPEGLSIYFNDISEQKQLEKSLENEKKRLYAILNGLPGLVYLRTPEGKVIFANHTFKEIHGEPDNRKCFQILFNREEPCNNCDLGIISNTAGSNQWQCVIKETIYEVYQHPFEDLDGSQLFVMQLLDITKRKIAEEEIAHLDRLNLVGELAAGIAHEVRNPMTTVRGFLQILKDKDVSQVNREYFDLMISELDRANSILTEFLSVAKTNNKLLTPIKLNNLVDSLYPLILADATNQDKQVTLETEEVPELAVNEREMRQLVLNLTRNGLEAMKPKGTLTIKTYRDTDSIVLAVKDQGSGISEEILERIGTPFQTTKEGGTGLGLSTCYGIAERHNANIEVTSSTSGTKFIVRFKLLKKK